MKIKGVIEDLKLIRINLKNDNSKNIFKNFSEAVAGSVGACVSSVSDSSLFQLILLLKVYRPLPM